MRQPMPPPVLSWTRSTACSSPLGAAPAPPGPATLALTRAFGRAKLGCPVPARNNGPLFVTKGRRPLARPVPSSSRSPRGKPVGAVCVLAAVAVMVEPAPVCPVPTPVPVTSGAPGGGGAVYKYDLDGAEVTYRVPPASFDPLKASARELALYGIPSPPRGQAAHAAWAEQMSKLHFVKAPASLVELPVHAAASQPGYSDHWAGYVAHGSTFKQMSSTWVEPVLRPSHCHGSSLTLWAGIGGYGSGSLAQAGTAEGTPEIANNQAWWEIWPQGMVPVPLHATPRAPFTVDVTYRGHGHFAFFMENDRTGAAWSHVETTTRSADLGTAESIAERPCLANCSSPTKATYAKLGNFGSVLFEWSLANGAPIGTFSNYKENMSDTGAPFGTALAFATPFAGNSMTFSVDQRACD